MGKAKFDGYAQEYDTWFMTNENVFLSELKLLKAALDLPTEVGFCPLAAAPGSSRKH